MREHKTDDGGSFYYAGNVKKALDEYALFRACIGQLLDDETMVGDVEGRWVVFKDGWVYGMATYATDRDAMAFGRQMLRDEPDATWIVVHADIEKHGLNSMEILASTFDDVEGFDISTTPDERGRPSE